MRGARQRDRSWTEDVTLDTTCDATRTMGWVPTVICVRYCVGPNRPILRDCREAMRRRSVCALCALVCARSLCDPLPARDPPCSLGKGGAPRRGARINIQSQTLNHHITII